jgi:hypothetical protein
LDTGGFALGKGKDSCSTKNIGPPAAEKALPGPVSSAKYRLSLSNARSAPTLQPVCSWLFYQQSSKNSANARL